MSVVALGSRSAALVVADRLDIEPGAIYHASHIPDFDRPNIYRVDKLIIYANSLKGKVSSWDEVFLAITENHNLPNECHP